MKRKPTFEDRLKKIRNKIRKYNPDQLVREAAYFLHGLKNLEIVDQLNNHPWLVFLLIKWACVYCDASKVGLSVNRSELLRLLRKVHSLERHAYLSLQMRSKLSTLLIVRLEIVRQLWLQDKQDTIKLGRQELLFARLQTNDKLARTFSGLYGLSISDFIELGMFLLVNVLIENRATIRESYFDPIKTAFPPEILSKFFEAISCDLASPREHLSTGHDPEYEFYEMTPLRRKPLYRMQSEYLSYSNPLTFHAISNFVYDALRKHDPQEFMTRFGSLYQRYVGDALRYAKVECFNDEQIRKYLGDGENVDYLACEKHATVLVEVKGGELPDVGLGGELLRGKNHPIIKGISQGIGTAKRLDERGEFCGKQVTKEKFLLIVGYKDFNVGSGPRFYRDLGAECIDKIVAEYGGNYGVPIENMFFISVEDLDVLSEHLNQTDLSLSEALAFAKEADANSMTAWFHLRQVLRRRGASGSPAYLSTAFDAMFKRCEARFSGTLVGKSAV